MEFVTTWLGALVAAIAVAFTALVATKAAAALWLAVTFVVRGIYWLTIGWWVNRLKDALMGY